MPWQTPKTNWTPDNGVSAADLNRIEENTRVLQEEGFTKTGGTVEGKITLAASVAAFASLAMPHGAAPSSPQNGDMWTTSSGLFLRLNGTTRTMMHTATYSTVTQAEAEQGTATTVRMWTAQRVAQAINRLAPTPTTTSLELTDTGNYYDTKNVEAALQEVGYALNGSRSNLINSVNSILNM